MECVVHFENGDGFAMFHYCCRRRRRRCRLCLVHKMFHLRAENMLIAIAIAITMMMVMTMMILASIPNSVRMCDSNAYFQYQSNPLHHQNIFVTLQVPISISVQM